MSHLSKQKGLECGKCKKTFRTDKALVGHWVDEGIESGHFFCGHCIKLFATEDLAAQHWVEMHRPKQELGCPGCGRVYAALGSFISHLEKDECKVLNRQLWDEMRTDYMAFAAELQRRDDLGSPHMQRELLARAGKTGKTEENKSGESAMNRLRPTVVKRKTGLDHVVLRSERETGERRMPGHPLFDPSIYHLRGLDLYCCPLLNCSKQFGSVEAFVDHLRSHAKPARVQCPGCNYWFPTLTGLALHVEAVGSTKCFVNESSCLGVLVAQLSGGLVDAVGTDDALKLSICKTAFPKFMAKRQEKQAGVRSGPSANEEEAGQDLDSAVGQFHFSEMSDDELSEARLVN